MPSPDTSFPQMGSPLSGDVQGVASLSHPDVTPKTLRFRTNPNEFTWSYTLNKRIDQTYGGRVVQLLGTKIDDFTFKADCGAGRWEYMNKVATFMRDIMIAQRSGVPATFEYTKRGWKLNCFIVSIPFQDAIEEVKREFEVTMKVQEDISGRMSGQTLSTALSRLKDGIAFQRGKYNDPRANPAPVDQEQALSQTISTLITAAAGNLGAVAGYIDPNTFLGNQGNSSSNNVGKK